LRQSKSLSGKMETPRSVGAAAGQSHAETKTADTPTRIQSMRAEKALHYPSDSSINGQVFLFSYSCMCRASANPYRPKCGIDTESVSEWIRNGQKSIELRKGKCKNGDDAVFQCESKILRGKIIIKEEGTLKDLLKPDTEHLR
jgi:hypothetical protein